MRAIQILGDVSSPRVVINHSVPKPLPRNDEILVKVHAAGITGDEVLWPELYSTESRIPGHEVSGTISATGPDYHGPLEVGQEVIALIAADRGEGQAEYAICLADEVAPKPSSLSHDEAAALPIPFLTAWEALVDHGNSKPGMRVLITGASGAVGSVAVQLATHLTDCHITALASCRHHDGLRRLGAQEVLDYNRPGWEHQIRDTDIVFDTVGGQVLTKTWETVKNDGFIVTVADPPPPWAFGRGVAAESSKFPAVRYKYFIVSPSSERLAKLSGMIRDCVITTLAVRSFPADEAEQAWAHARQRNHGSKVVVNFS
jgi:NADPH:quinone reductase-like Zn-dependent oxidoreductase